LDFLKLESDRNINKLLNNANDNKLYTNSKLNIRNNENINIKDNNTYSQNIENKNYIYIQKI
jgi:hypothetical protein